jgi:hypothetical protein
MCIIYRSVVNHIKILSKKYYTGNSMFKPISPLCDKRYEYSEQTFYRKHLILIPKPCGLFFSPNIEKQKILFFTCFFLIVQPSKDQNWSAHQNDGCIIEKGPRGEWCINLLCLFQRWDIQLYLFRALLKTSLYSHIFLRRI